MNFNTNKMEKYQDQIEYVAEMCAYLLPFYVGIKIYVMLKARQYSKSIKNNKEPYYTTLDIVLLSAAVIMMLAAFFYLNTTQRYIAIALDGILFVVIAGVSYFANLFGYKG